MTKENYADNIRKYPPKDIEMSKRGLKLPLCKCGKQAYLYMGETEAEIVCPCGLIVRVVEYSDIISMYEWLMGG